MSSSAACCLPSSRWARTWAPGRSWRPASTARARPRCGTSGGTSSPSEERLYLLPSNYVDTHGASVVGFAFTELLNLWGLIEQQYDLMVKYDTALRLGKAEAEQVLRRFARGGPEHPTYQALERTRARGAHGLRLSLPRQPRPAPRDPRRAPGRRELEQCEHRAPLRKDGALTGSWPNRPGRRS